MSLQHDVKDLPLADEGRDARLKLQSMGMSIDQLTTKQEKYLASWEEGT